ncbi:MAG: ATP-dependent Clp protease proteolytic subunit [Streptosporangiales bacterium]|nr:ATP-dependent Clp protease proteolytic subunit [Streptosporangiales bacterium]
MISTARYQPPGRPPPPYGPGRPPGPRPPGPGGPGEGRGGGVPDWLQERLFERRIIVVRGRLDHDGVTRLAAQIVALDADGNDPIEMHLDCPDADLGAALLLMDAVALAGSPVHAIAAGQVGGAALGILVAADRRLALPHARFRLAEPRAELAGGKADQVVRGASQHLQMLEALIVRLAEVTGRPRHTIEDDLGEGHFLTADQAVEYGLVEAVRRRGAEEGQ